MWCCRPCPRRFLSTPSARRATAQLAALTAELEEFLSTPSARRATRLRPGWFRPIRYFYPRPPRGGRPSTTRMVSANPIFLSTPSARRATIAGNWAGNELLFLSTPSARRATMLCRSANSATLNFYPRPPRGGRRVDIKTHADRDDISIHALREEGDGGTSDGVERVTLFLSTPSARRATVLCPAAS